MAKLTEKNTKAEILSAYEETKKKLEAAQADKVDPRKEIADKAEKTIIEKAVKATAIDTVSLTNALMEMVNKLDAITEAYADVEDAIAVKKAELQEIYGIEKEASSLFALVNAKKEVADKTDAEMTVRVKDWEAKIEQLRNDYAAARADLELSRKRDSEQYEYDLDRKKRLDHDKLQDELIARKTRFNDELKADIAKLNEKSEAIAKREAAVLAAEEKYAEFEALEISVAKLKDDVRDKAIEINRIKKEFEYEKSLLLKDSHATIALLEAKVESLQEALDDAKYNNKTLSDKLDEAYTSLKEMANETAKSSSNASTIAALKDVARNSNSKV